MHSDIASDLELLVVNQLQLGILARRAIKDERFGEIFSFPRQIEQPLDCEKELIQVAASAIAALTDLRISRGEGTKQDVEEAIILEVFKERERQDGKFTRKFPTGYDPLFWFFVLTEELSEALALLELPTLMLTPAEQAIIKENWQYLPRILQPEEITKTDLNELARESDYSALCQYVQAFKSQQHNLYAIYATWGEKASLKRRSLDIALAKAVKLFEHRSRVMELTDRQSTNPGISPDINPDTSPDTPDIS
jgi:hypothetical protein